MENPIKMDDLGGKPTIFGNIHIMLVGSFFLGGGIISSRNHGFYRCEGGIFLMFHVWKVDDLCLYCLLFFFMLFFFATKVRFVELPVVS